MGEDPCIFQIPSWEGFGVGKSGDYDLPSLGRDPRRRIPAKLA